MSGTLEDAVAEHYEDTGLTERILRALADAGADPERLTPDQIAPIDEFHIGGRPATAHVVDRMRLTASDHVLDVGCGLGGATRYIAATVGCRVTGLDLTPAYVAAAVELTRRTGLADRAAYCVGSALAMPFADAAFDAAITLHVAMNIQDRAGLYREVARVLRPGAVLGIYDVMRGAGDGLAYPLPWAQTPATSHLTTPGEMQVLLAAAGFELEETEDRTDFARDFLRRSQARAASGPPAPGLQLVMGDTAREKLGNLLAGIEGGAVAPTVMLARRR